MVFFKQKFSDKKFFCQKIPNFSFFFSEIQREGAKAETEWAMARAQRREYEKDMPKDNDYFRKMYMNREETAEPEMTRWVDRVKKPGDAFMAAAKKAQRRERKGPV